MKRALRAAAAAVVVVACGSVFGMTGLGPYAPSQANAAEVQLRTVASFPRTIYFTQEFVRFSDEFNARNKGVLTLDFRGGPEAIPPAEQHSAAISGVVDLALSAAPYYQGMFAESAAYEGSQKDIGELRRNGAIDLLNELMQKKMGVYLLAVFDGGVRFHFFTKDAPKLDARGLPDFQNLKVRSTPLYQGLITTLGGSPVSIQIPELYTGLERGVVDAIGFPNIGLADMKLERFIKYRVDPGFLRNTTFVIVNLAKWKSLGDDARGLLTKEFQAEESKIYQTYAAQAAKELDQLKASGLAVVELSADARKKFLEISYDEPWERLAKRDPTHVEALKAKFK
jgi:TRAP-type C4-dicarboxylate transport system substrate-binding protein